MHASTLPATLRDTYANLRVFAWAGFETPDLSWEQVVTSTGKDRKTLYRHLLALVNKGVTRWRTASSGLIRLTFTDGIGGAENCLKIETTAAQFLKNETPQNRGGDTAPVVSADGQPDTPVLPGKTAGRLKIENSQKREMPLSSLKSLTLLSKESKTSPKKRAKRLKIETSQKRDNPTAAPIPAAVEAYRSISRRFPDRATHAMIAERVGDSAENLELWKLTVQGWIAAGHKKTNVEGMLDWFKQGKTSQGAPFPNGRTPPKPRLPDGV